MSGEIRYLLPQQRNISKGSKNWYGGKVENGLTSWFSLKTEKKSEAMDWYSKMQARRWLPPERQQSAVSIDEAAEKFLSEVENVRRRAKGTVRIYRQNMGHFRAWCLDSGLSSMQDITAQHCGEFVSKYFDLLASSSAKTKLIMFRQFFSWAQDSYDLPGKNPFKKIMVPKSNAAPRDFWTVEQCEKIISAAPGDECRCWFALMAFAGLRREEARNLALGNLKELDNPSGGKISLVGKGGKHASIPISSRLRGYLDKWLLIRGNEPGKLFPKLGSLAKAKEEIIKTAVANSGIQSEGLSHFHRFRHSFASNLLRMGRSIKAVQMLMRHENVTLTLNTYGHLLPSDLEQAAEL